MVFSVKGDHATGMKALSWTADWRPLPLLRDATSLEVPTSRPSGFAAAFTRSSMRSGDSSATFQRWSLLSAILSILGFGWAPEPASSLRRFVPFRCAHPRPGLSHDAHEAVIVAEAEERHRRGGLPVLVGEPEGLEGEPARPVEVVPDEVLLHVHAREAVGHAHVGRNIPVLAQVVGEAPSRRELGLGDGQGAAALPACLEAHPEERVVEAQEDVVSLGPDRVARVVRFVAFRDHPEDLAKAVDQVVVDPVAPEVAEQALAAVAELLVEALLEGPDVALRGVEEYAHRPVVGGLLHPTA